MFFIYIYIEFKLVGNANQELCKNTYSFHTKEYYLPINRNEVLIHATTWIHATTLKTLY